MSDAIGAAAASAARRGAALHRMTVVDDNQELVELLAEGLDGRCVVQGCEDPSIASIAATRPDLLFIDLWTAGKGDRGWAFLDQVRNDGALGRVPLIVSSATSLEDDGGLERLRDQTGVYFLSKPFAFEQLESLISRAERNDAAPDGAGKPTGRTDAAPR